MRDRNEKTPKAAGTGMTIQKAYERAAKSLNKTTDRLTQNEKLNARNKALGLDVTPIPIGLVPLIKVVKVRKTSRRADIFKLGVHTQTMMAWNPKEMHRFWRRMLGENKESQ